MTEIRCAARISSIHVIASPSLGRTYVEVEFAVVMESLYESVKEASPFLLLPIHLYMRYPWEDDSMSVPIT